MLCTQDVKAVSRVRVSRASTVCICKGIWVKSWGDKGNKAGRDGQIKMHICKYSYAATGTLPPPDLPRLAINSISNSVGYISSGSRTGATVRKLQIGTVKVFGEYGRGDFRQTDDPNPEMRRTSFKHSCYIV